MRALGIVLLTASIAACSPEQTTPKPVPAPEPQPPQTAAPAPVPVAELRPPECGDAQTLATVRNIIREKMLPGDANKAMPQQVFDAHVSIEKATPERYDRDIYRYDCSGVLAVDASAGLDPVGNVVVNSPQMLHNAGTSVAEVERIFLSDFNRARRQFAFPIAFQSQRAGEDHLVRVANIEEVRLFFTGSFVAAHHQQALKKAEAQDAPAARAEATAGAQSVSNSPPAAQPGTDSGAKN
jgi:hypothetical protein